MTHDYALSVDELLKKSDSFNSIADKLKQSSPDLATENLEKATYYGCLGTLKNCYKHPYDAVIFDAEELALKNDFKGAIALLIVPLLEYTRKDIK